MTPRAATRASRRANKQAGTGEATGVARRAGSLVTDSGPEADSGLVIVAKSAGMTSHDVVSRIRRLARTRRVGHAGTLDPMATGVLVIGIGKATRLLGHLSLTEKEYEATIRLGQSTVTDDAEGEVLQPAAESPAGPASAIGEAAVRAALAGFRGQIMQVPPKVSAIKVNGERAYRLTRAGEAPELAARPVTISKIDLLAIRPAADMLDADVAITCSSGTYIRAIARDLGAVLGTGGHLTALRRTRVGPYRLAEARSLEQLASNFECVPLAVAAKAAFPFVILSAQDAGLLSHGARISARALGHDGPSAAEMPGPTQRPAGQPSPGEREGRPVAAFDPEGTLIALVTEQDNEIRPLTVFVP